MKILLFLFLTSTCFAQHRYVSISPNGDTVLYAPYKEKIAIHDTTRLVIEKHDTIEHWMYVEKRTVPEIIDVHVITQIPDTVRITEKRKAVRFGVFGYGAFRSDAIGPGVLFDLGQFQIILFAGMSYYGPADNRRTVGEAGVAGFVAF